MPLSARISHLYSAVEGRRRISIIPWREETRCYAYLFRPLFSFIFRATQRRDYVTVAVLLKRTGVHHSCFLFRAWCEYLFFILLLNFFAFFTCLPVNALSRNRGNFMNPPNRLLQLLIYRSAIRITLGISSYSGLALEFYSLLTFLYLQF